MRFSSAIVTLALAMASVEHSFSFSTSSTSTSSVARQQQQQQQATNSVLPSTSALSVASADIVDGLRPRKTREVRHCIALCCLRQNGTGGMFQILTSHSFLLSSSVGTFGSSFQGFAGPLRRSFHPSRRCRSPRKTGRGRGRLERGIE